DVLQRSMRLHSTNKNYILQKINILRQAYEQTNEERYYNEVTDLIGKVKKREPYNRHLYEEEYRLKLKNSDHQNVMEFLREGLNYFPWDITLYERAIELCIILGVENSNYLNEAIRYYDDIQERRGYI